MTLAALSATVARLLAARGNSAPGDRQQLERTVGQLLSAGRQEWPDLTVSDRTFLHHLEQILVDTEDIEAAVDGMHAGDFFLATACANGDEQAIACFERRYGEEISATLRKVKAPAGLEDEVHQVVRCDLFLPRRNGRPGIASYAGRGGLAGWLRVVVTRAALRMIKNQQKRGGAGDEDLSVLAATGDPEIDFLKRKYSRAFKAAITGAIRSLAQAHRVQLKLYYCDRLTMEQIAALYQVHQTTVTRNLQAARRMILNETRARLVDELAVAASDVDSIMNLIHSRMELTLQTFLPSADDHDLPVGDDEDPAPSG